MRIMILNWIRLFSNFDSKLTLSQRDGVTHVDLGIGDFVPIDVGPVGTV